MKRASSLRWDDMKFQTSFVFKDNDADDAEGGDTIAPIGIRKKSMRRAKTSSPPPGFGAGGSLATGDPELTGSDNALNTQQPSLHDDASAAENSAKPNRLKRCVTFSTMPPKLSGNTERGCEDHLKLREMDGVDASVPESRIRRVNSSQILRQAFPTTIFDSVQGVEEGSVDGASGSLSDSLASMRAVLDSSDDQPLPSSGAEFEYSPMKGGAHNGASDGPTGYYDYNSQSWQNYDTDSLFGATASVSAGNRSGSGAPRSYAMPPFPSVGATPPPALQAPGMPPMPQMPPMPSQAQLTPQQLQQQQAFFYQMYSAHMQAWAAAAAQAGHPPHGMPFMPGMMQPPPVQAPPAAAHAGRGNHRHGRSGHPRAPRGHHQPRAASSHQSALLLEHKSTGRRVEMSELKGHIVEFARDSHGSRFVQYKMECADDSDKAALFEEVLPVAVELSNDVFGNYVLQNMLSNGDAESCKALIHRFLGHVLELSMKMHSCRVVQRALQVACPEQRRQLIAELLPHIGICARDPHATHVCQRICSLVESDQRALLERAVDAELIELSVHPNACRFVQRVLGSKIDAQRPLISAMIKTIKANINLFSTDQQANFILQRILAEGSKADADFIHAYVRNNVERLAVHKFASHLVEKALVESSAQQRQALLRAILGRLLDADPKLDEPTLALMRDAYSNFVIQRAFDSTPGKQRVALTNAILRHADVLSRFTYGRHILSHCGGGGK